MTLNLHEDGVVMCIGGLYACHAWIREEMERVERFSSSGKGMK